MALLDDVKVMLRVTSTLTDSDVQTCIDAAFADMARVGVRSDLLDEDEPAPLVKMAVVLYCKAHYGYDNDEAPRFSESYRQTVLDMLNSPTSYGPLPVDASEDSEEEDE